MISLVDNHEHQSTAVASVDHIHQVACHECDLLLTLPKLEPGLRAVCPRCENVITRIYPNAEQKLVAYGVSGLIFFVLSLIFPFLTFTSSGNERVVNLIESIQSIGTGDLMSVAVMLTVTVIFVPLIFVCGVLYVTLSLHWARPLPYAKQVLKLIFGILPWNMAEIFLVGILVSFIKIAAMADIALGLSFLAFILFILCMAAMSMYLDKYQLWSKLNDCYH